MRVRVPRYATSFGVETGDEMLATWRNFWMELFALTRDFMVVTPPHRKQCTGGQRVNCTSRSLPDAADVGYSAAWYARIVEDGDNAKHYGVPASSGGRGGAAHDHGDGALDRAKLLVLAKKSPWSAQPAHQ